MENILKIESKKNIFLPPIFVLNLRYSDRKHGKAGAGASGLSVFSKSNPYARMIIMRSMIINAQLDNQCAALICRRKNRKANSE